MGTNNHSDTVFDSFIKEMDEYGLPFRVRMDSGGKKKSSSGQIHALRT